MRRVTKMVALAGLAVPAAAGCVSVDAPAAGPAGASVPAAPSAGPALQQPQLLRPPAREAVSDPEPVHSSSAPGSTNAGSSHAPSSARDGRLAPRSAAHPGAPERAPTPRRPGPEPAPVVTPPSLRHLPSGAGVCDLGRAYGHWREDGDAARICDDAYGR
jgi:hypothetical protein